MDAKRMGDESGDRSQNRQRSLKIATRSLEKLVEAGPNSDEKRLPPERELAAQLGISRRMLRTGLERLEAAGRIWRHQGKGTFLGSRPSLDSREVLLTDSAANPLEVLEARKELEPNLAALAALRATPAEVREIRRCLKRSKSAADLDTFELWDGTLHRAIAQAVHNSLLLSLFDTVNIVRSRSFWGRLQDAAIAHCGLHSIWLQHKDFVEAIAARDPAEARRLMRIHIDTVRNSMFDLANSTEGDVRQEDHADTRQGASEASEPQAGP
jgi:DNA-binding FadR family transcriptional regulator